eukprot:199252-Pleurochrysis_carterae.AAC.1
MSASPGSRSAARAATTTRSPPVRRNHLRRFALTCVPLRSHACKPAHISPLKEPDAHVGTCVPAAQRRAYLHRWRLLGVQPPARNCVHTRAYLRAYSCREKAARILRLRNLRSVCLHLRRHTRGRYTSRPAHTCARVRVRATDVAGAPTSLAAQLLTRPRERHSEGPG